MQADETGSTGDAADWAVKRTEIAEQPDEGLGGTETAQTESAEQPGQRDAESRDGRAEITERKGDSAAAPKAGGLRRPSGRMMARAARRSKM